MTYVSLTLFYFVGRRIVVDIEHALISADLGSEPIMVIFTFDSS